jgi:hypothetical protein
MEAALKDLIDGCKEEKMTLEEALAFLPSAILAAGQRSPQSGLLTESMDVLLEKVKEFW